MSLESLLNGLPFVEHLGIEIEAIEEGYARGRVELTPELSSVPGRKIAHGGVAYSLADTVGGASVMSLHYAPTPTIDMRIDYLAPGQSDLVAEAEVVRDGNSVAVTEVEIRDAEGSHVADARGVFKTGGGEGETAWGPGSPESTNGGTE
ncbi:PaaI family thioesterase [Haloprofundus sp. MHR1]|uniref:PaaI family thioesterase n=1 Tax=Haloprofundus sp. MHR1 TaxID=2572921 RepID=UPI0010BE3133|nr:PaaI family thioesterase [Haloprofundus sp. MHR1]QCJ47331.1 PaaI family thioesterase [Haloprofundus sp. MHR1]